MPKIGILGGTFDPIHNGHIEMAKAAKLGLGLLEVLFITGGNPPHKKEKKVTDAHIRHEMVESAIKGIDGFRAIDYEIKKENYSYTAETLKFLKNENPEDEYFFIVGADSLDYIDKWYLPEEIFKIATLVAFSRNDFEIKKKAKALEEKFGGKIIILDDKISDISSTGIRLLVDMDEDVSGLVPKSCVEYIKTHRLYRDELSKIRIDVKKSLEEKRYIHTLGVAKMCVRLAKLYGVDIKKAYLAGLLHDIAKNIPKDEMLNLSREKEVSLDDFEWENPHLIHPKLGAVISHERFGIEDPDILNAISWHTLGREGMSDLEKIVYVSDMIEEGRCYPEVEFLRRVAFENLDKAVYHCIDATIQFNKGKKIHPSAFSVRDFYKDKVLN